MTKLDVSLPLDQEAIATDQEGIAIPAPARAFRIADVASTVAEEKRPARPRWRRRDWLLVVSAALSGLLVANAIVRHRKPL